MTNTNLPGGRFHPSPEAKPPSELDFGIYFKPSEFACKCGCGNLMLSQRLLDNLKKLRECLDRPLIITSGYRCPNHPIERRKIAAGGMPGRHAEGLAADITLTGKFSLSMLRDAVAMYSAFRGIGVDSFQKYIHVDVRNELKRAWWTYDKNGNQLYWVGPS